MKKHIIMAVVLFCFTGILIGCAKEKAEEGDKKVDLTVSAAPEPTADQKQKETEDAFTQLFPDRESGRIPKGPKFQELAKTLTGDIKGRLTEITYTYRSTKLSMETLVGNRENVQEKHPADNSVFRLLYGDSEYYNYVLYLPEGYDPQDSETKWPVIYFFHGIGEKGEDLTKLLSYGVPKYIKETGRLDAIMIAPQCPAASHWADTDVEEPKLEAFVWENAEKYHIDTDRMYLTGLSMGGRCTWKQALAMPDAFAAAAVVCGRTNTYDFSGILDMPIWMFHGAADDTVSFDNVNRIVEELYRQEHEYFKLTVYPYLSHDSWTTAYARPDLYEWLLAQNLQNRKQAE
ncbi:dienelactone hydrolase [Anaerotaenia torta]|uniref:carboxylesterase family protein n=1 Tax=Anaerotaenia torta TaxID=433293 RepID=UPI003D1993DC